MELHHVVFVGEPGSKNVYAVDFSPLNQKDNLLRLFFGIDVPAEIRIRLLNTGMIPRWNCDEIVKSPSDCTSIELTLRLYRRCQMITDDVNDVENIYKKWSCLNKMSNGERSPPHHDLLLLDNDLRLAQKFITRVIKRWDTSMNAYTHNCQHFSWFVKDLLKEEEVCPL